MLPQGGDKNKQSGGVNLKILQAVWNTTDMTNELGNPFFCQLGIQIEVRYTYYFCK